MVRGELSESLFEEVYAKLDVEVFFLEVIDVLFAIAREFRIQKFRN